MKKVQLFHDNSVGGLQEQINAWLKDNEYAVILHTNLSSHVAAQTPAYTFYILYELVLPAGLETDVAREELDVRTAIENDIGMP